MDGPLGKLQNYKKRLGQNLDQHQNNNKIRHAFKPSSCCILKVLFTMNSNFDQRTSDFRRY